MGDLSPVLAAYLEGQKGQTTLLQHAHNIINEREQRKLQREQLEAAIKQHGIENTREQGQLDLQLKKFGLEHQIALTNHENMIREQFAKGTRSAEGTNFAVPGLQSPQLSIPTSAQNLQQTITGVNQGPGTIVNTPNETQFADTPMGPMSIKGVDTPELQMQQHIKDILAQIPAEVAKTTAIEGVKHKYGLENIQTKIDAMEQIAKDHARSAELIANNKNATAIDIQSAKNDAANARTQADIYKTFFNMGIDPGEPAAFKNAVEDRLKAVSLGKDNLGNTPIDKHVKVEMEKRGLVIPQGGTKFGDDVNAITTSSNRLLNDFDQLNQKFPAADTLVGRLVNKGQTLPLVSGMTDIGQNMDLFKSNIAGYASKVGETPSMMRSVMLAKKAEGAMPTAQDLPSVRIEKRNKLVDLTFDKLQEKIGNLSKEQRLSFWRDAINNMPSIKKDYRFKNVLEDIMKNGVYNPSLLVK